MIPGSTSMFVRESRQKASGFVFNYALTRRLQLQASFATTPDTTPDREGRTIKRILLSEASFLVYVYFQAHCSHHEGHEEHEEDWNTKRLTAAVTLFY